MSRRLRRPARLLSAALLLAVVGLLARGAQAQDEPDRDLEPVPRVVLFTDVEEGVHDPISAREVEREIQRAFASLGDVQGARRVIVRRFGVVAVPELVAALRKGNVQAQTWNAALTIGALRDVDGPALQLLEAIRPLVRILATQSDAFHNRAMAALALGCFHWTDARPVAGAPAEDSAVPGPTILRARAARALDDARRELVRRSNDDQSFMRVAALLALAKMGGDAVREQHEARSLTPFANTTPLRASLLTHAFLGSDDAAPVLQALTDDDRRVRAAGALAVAVAQLREDPAPWTNDVPALLKALGNPRVSLVTEEGAEAVFARGICALRHQVEEPWRDLLRIATLASSERRTAEAAAQVLKFCELDWMQQEMVRWAAEPQVELKPPVLALVLLRAGEQGAPQGLEACAEWLRNRSRRPAPSARWDPRWYAGLGLLRALHHGRIRAKAERQRAIDALRRAASSVLDRKSAYREALGALLEAHGEAIAAAPDSALVRLPLEDLLRVERSFECPHGLLTRDPVDACVLRVNAAVEALFNLDGIIPWKPGEPTNKQMPERFLQRYLEHHPYFSRLEFLTARGARPQPSLTPGRPGIDR